MAVTTARRAPLGPMLLLQTWAEFLKLWRVPAFTLTSLFLPVMFYAFIGVGQSSQKIFPNVTFGAYFLASMAVYSVANVMIFSFGISVATERGMKMDLLMRATPMPPFLYLVSKSITALFFAALTLVVLFPFAYIAGHVRLDMSAWVTLASRVRHRLPLGAEFGGCGDQPDLPAHSIRIGPLLSEAAPPELHPVDRAIPAFALLRSARMGRSRRTYRRQREHGLAVPGRLWRRLFRRRSVGVSARGRQKVQLDVRQNSCGSSIPNDSW